MLEFWDSVFCERVGVCAGLFFCERGARERNDFERDAFDRAHTPHGLAFPSGWGVWSGGSWMGHQRFAGWLGGKAEFAPV